MTDREQDEEDLRATADSVVDGAARIATLEREKMRLDPADPRVEQISAEIEQLAAKLMTETAAEHAIAADLNDAKDERVH